MVEKVFVFKEGNPYFLQEFGNGIFSPVKGAKCWPDGYVEYVKYDNKLVVGHDMHETHNRSMSIVLKSRKKGADVFHDIINECFKLAEISKHNYVSLEKIDGKFARLLGFDGDSKVLEIRPRLFKKIVN